MQLPKHLTQWFLARAYSSKLSRWRRENDCEIVNSRVELHEHVASHVGRDTSIEYLEFGVYRGATIELWSEANQHSGSRFVGFDSFEGLPERWNSRYVEGHFSTGGQLPRIDDPRVTFRKGWFNDTLPDYLEETDLKRQIVVHLDADLYSSTLYVLSRLGPTLAPGSIVILDDFLYAQDVFRAFADFQQAYPIQLSPLVCAPSARGTPYAQVALIVSANGKC